MMVVQQITDVQRIARICHEVNREYCAALGDHAQPVWEDAPDWQRESAIHGVEFHLANPDAGPEDGHKNWLRQKEADGWKNGPVKDPEKKEHPCCVPFAELSKEHQAKDCIFRAIVHGMQEQVPMVLVSQSEASCLRKLKLGEPSFTLRAQDVTSDLTVSFWVRVNAYLRDLIARGYTPALAVGELKRALDEAFPLKPTITDLKLLEALDYSMEMGEWQDRKLAD